MKKLLIISVFCFINQTFAQSSMPRLAFMGLPRFELSTDFQSTSIYAGYGFYTTYVVTGNIGPEVRFAKNNFLIGPKASMGLVLPFLQFSLSMYAPFKDNELAIILNPKIGTNLVIGIFYLEFGYNINLRSDLGIPNSLNMGIGVNVPLNIEKFIANI
ncbi:MAG: hypothetical protein IT222_07770 [Crocinitomix sp.]|nr:hypothetical protein [Crocinitomix sp.]